MLAQVSMCDSVRRSLFKYNSTVVKRFYPSGGQRNTLAQPMKLNETAAGGIITRSRGPGWSRLVTCLPDFGI